MAVHLGVVLPRLGDHHQHGVRQRPAAHVQQLEHLVERRGVGRPRRADRVEPLEVAGDQVGGEQRLAGPHPVAVAHHGVDLAVVGDVAERVGQRPAREGVGREPRVHDRQRRGDPLVGEVGEEVVELVGRQHPLVDQGPRGQRREVDVGLLLRALAQAERLALQRHPGDARRRRRPRRPARTPASRCGRSSPSDLGPAPAPRASPARPGPPRRRSPRSRRRDLADVVGRRRRRSRCRRRRSGAGGRSKSTTSRRNASGTWSRMPAPSPELTSAPAAPRWSRLRSAVRAWSTMVRLGTPVRVATKATPQASCSKRGS